MCITESKNSNPQQSTQPNLLGFDQFKLVWITAASFADPLILAITTPPSLTFGYITDVDTEFNTKIAWKIGTDTSGTNFRVTANHEFAHWVDFNDVHDSIP